MHEWMVKWLDWLTSSKVLISNQMVEKFEVLEGGIVLIYYQIEMALKMVKLVAYFPCSLEQVHLHQQIKMFFYFDNSFLRTCNN
ncbi:Phosphoenolpyruvate carboxykinase [GTP] [Bienertia sinuspersici]